MTSKRKKVINYLGPVGHMKPWQQNTTQEIELVINFKTLFTFSKQYSTKKVMRMLKDMKTKTT